MRTGTRTTKRSINPEIFRQMSAEFPQTGTEFPQTDFGKKVAQTRMKSGFLLDFPGCFCYTFIVTRRCAQAFDTPGRLDVRPAEMRWGIVTELLVPQFHKAHVLCQKYVAGRLLKYSAESIAGCDTTIPALDSALSFFGSLPAFFIS